MSSTVPFTLPHLYTSLYPVQQIVSATGIKEHNIKGVEEKTLMPAYYWLLTILKQRKKPSTTDYYKLCSLSCFPREVSRWLIVSAHLSAIILENQNIFLTLIDQVLLKYGTFTSTSKWKTVSIRQGNVKGLCTIKSLLQ